jgi:hypothetical protein
VLTSVRRTTNRRCRLLIRRPDLAGGRGGEGSRGMGNSEEEEGAGGGAGREGIAEGGEGVLIFTARQLWSIGSVSEFC